VISAVIDTNVFVSAFLTGGSPLAAIESVRLGKTRLLVTAEMVSELERIVLRPKFSRYFTSRSADPLVLMRTYTVLARYVTPVLVSDCPIADPDDLKFIECAVGGGAEVIVSGDHHLLTIGRYNQIEMLTPTQFLTRIADTD
jgi:putative PIN family toxin of toxin-antitoxin system